MTNQLHPVAVYDYSVWSFSLKRLIMYEAAPLCIPPTFSNESELAGTEQDAAESFKYCPELKEGCDKPPDGSPGNGSKTTKRKPAGK